MSRRRNSKGRKPRFAAASKIIGMAILGAMIGIIIYSMFVIPKVAEDAIKMGISPDMSALNTLIGGIFTVSAAYIGFYINMAKAEHIEDKKNEIKRQIQQIEKDGITVEEAQELMTLKEDLYALNQKLDDISGDINMNGGFNG